MVHQTFQNDFMNAVSACIKNIHYSITPNGIYLYQDEVWDDVLIASHSWEFFNNLLIDNRKINGIVYLNISHMDIKPEYRSEYGQWIVQTCLNMAEKHNIPFAMFNVPICHFEYPKVN